MAYLVVIQKGKLWVFPFLFHQNTFKSFTMFLYAVCNGLDKPPMFFRDTIQPFSFGCPSRGWGTRIGGGGGV